MTLPPPPSLAEPLAVAEVPPMGRTVVIEADETARAALAAACDVVSVEAFRAELKVAPWSGKGWSVTGRVVARLTQSCVVTLEPVETTVDEAVAVKLVPAAELAAYLEPAGPDGAIDLDASSADVPDGIDGDTIDVGAIAYEHFALGIDPYPRRPGAVFEPEAAGVADPAEHLSPFAALARRSEE